jgi:hypothetical protein
MVKNHLNKSNLEDRNLSNMQKTVVIFQDHLSFIHIVITTSNLKNSELIWKLIYF